MAGPRPSSGKTKFEAIVQEANRLHNLALPYSNARPPSDNVGYDCSSACAQLMRSAGYQVPFFSTADAPDYMNRGRDPSGRLTFWNNDYNRTAGNSVHMFATINGRDWGTGYGGGGGPGWVPHTKSGFEPYWINGLDEPAGAPLDPVGSAPQSGNLSLNESTAKAAAFATYFHIDGLTERLQSDFLKGEHSLMNDRPLFPFIEQLCAASLRRFQSLPNGDFFAFYPDYFGGLKHRTPYWEINDIEIIDGQIELNDDSLATHVFVVGDTSEVSFFNGIDIIDEINSVGAINLFSAFQANFITGTSGQKRPNDENILNNVVNAEKFLDKYGARPYYEQAPMVRSTFFEAFLAYQKFCLLWSQQFATTFNLTFMPEIFPGGLVRFPQHGLQMFVEEVTHTFDMEAGFETDVVFTSPSSIGKGNLHEGMIRGGVLDDSK